MRQSLASLLLLLSALLAGGPAPAAEVPQDSQVVVTFNDRSITRSDFGQPGHHYAPTGDYPSSDWSRRLTKAVARDYKLEIDTSWPIVSLGVHCVVYRIPDHRDVANLMSQLAADKRISSVQKMNRFQVLGAKSYVSLQSNLAAMGVDEAHHIAQGRKVKVAVVDTGIDASHPDLREQVMDTRDLVNPGNSPAGGEIHGTAVAGLIAAHADDGQGITGVAPRAELFGLRACWALEADSTAAACDSLTLARALVAVLKLRPQVLNLSLTGPHDPLLSALLAQVQLAGVIVVAAEPPASGEPAGFPVDDAAVIRVSAGDNGSKVPAGVFSAPGTDVLTTFPGNNFSFVTGSSFAAAQVSGIVALLKELNPSLSSLEVRQILEGSLSATLAGREVDACAAVAKLAGSLVCRPADVLVRSGNPRAQGMPPSTDARPVPTNETASRI